MQKQPTGEDQRRRAEDVRADAAKGDPARPGPAGQWRPLLPEKQAREVIDAKSRPMPAQYRKALEEYYRRLSEPPKPQ